MNTSINNNKKTGRGSPSSVRDSSPVTRSNKDALLALKSILSVPAQAQSESAVAPQQPAAAVLALKALLSVPNKVEPTTPVERPKAEAVQALKNLLLSPPRTEEAAQTEPASFKALKMMLLAGKKEEISVERPVQASGLKRASSPKTISVSAAGAKVTPPRSEKKKKQKPSSIGKSPFAGSLFQSSPDPTAMPMPDFDEVQSSFFSDDMEESQPTSVSPPQDQLASLRMILKIPA